MVGVGSDSAELARQLEDVREQQRAISGVLRAVALSSGLQPVLDEVVAACQRLCQADEGALYLLQGELLRSAARTGGLPVAVETGFRFFAVPLLVVTGASLPVRAFAEVQAG